MFSTQVSSNFDNLTPWRRPTSDGTAFDVTNASFAHHVLSERRLNALSIFNRAEAEPVGDLEDGRIGTVLWYSENCYELPET